MGERVTDGVSISGGSLTGQQEEHLQISLILFIRGHASCPPADSTVERTDLSLATDVFLNLLIVTESSCNRSQPRRFSAFFKEAGLSVFPAGAFSYRQQHHADLTVPFIWTYM